MLVTVSVLGYTWLKICVLQDNVIRDCFFNLFAAAVSTPVLTALSLSTFKHPTKQIQEVNCGIHGTDGVTSLIFSW